MIFPFLLSGLRFLVFAIFLVLPDFPEDLISYTLYVPVRVAVIEFTLQP